MAAHFDFLQAQNESFQLVPTGSLAAQQAHWDCQSALKNDYLLARSVTLPMHSAPLVAVADS